MERKYKIRLDCLKKDKYEMTSQGFLKADAYVTRTGVFDYYEDDKLIRELRPMEEVFNIDSMETLKMIPITSEHPDGMVDTTNNKSLNVGMTGENVVREGDYLKTKVLITDANCIKEIMKRKSAGLDTELSCGYDVDLVDTCGEHETDGKYDRVQTNIKYNHLAIVDEGRAGSKVKIKLDHNAQTQNNNLQKIHAAIRNLESGISRCDPEHVPEIKKVISHLKDVSKKIWNPDFDQSQAVKIVDWPMLNNAMSIVNGTPFERVMRDIKAMLKFDNKDKKKEPKEKKEIIVKHNLDLLPTVIASLLLGTGAAFGAKKLLAEEDKKKDLLPTVIASLLLGTGTAFGAKKLLEEDKKKDLLPTVIASLLLGTGAAFGAKKLLAEEDKKDLFPIIPFGLKATLTPLGKLVSFLASPAGLLSGFGAGVAGGALAKKIHKK